VTNQLNKLNIEIDSPVKNTKVFSNTENEKSRDHVTQDKNKQNLSLYYITTTQPKTTVWTYDTGASEHITNDKSILEDFTEMDLVMKCVNKSICRFDGFGTFRGYINGKSITLDKVLYSKDTNKNLLGGVRLAKGGYIANISHERKHTVLRLFKNNNMIGKFKSNKANVIRIPIIYDPRYSLNSTELDDKSMKIWHNRLGHYYQDNISQYLELHNIKQNKCLECGIAKLRNKPHNKTPPKANRILEVIHSDIMGPISPASNDGFKYVITFIDEFSRKAWIHLMKEKSEASNIIVEFLKYIDNHFDKKIKYFKSDNAKEYNNSKVKKLCKKMGIKKIFSTPYNPQNNGIAERYNQTLINSTKTLIYWAKLSLDFWSYAIIYSNYLYNITPHSNISNLIPNEIFYNRDVSLSKVKVFGCTFYYNNIHDRKSKIEVNSRKGIFLGIDFDSNSYITMDTEDQKIHLVQNGTFLEEVPANYKFRADLGNFKTNKYKSLNDELNYQNIYDNKFVSREYSDIRILNGENNNTNNETGSHNGYTIDNPNNTETQNNNGNESQNTNEIKPQNINDNENTNSNMNQTNMSISLNDVTENQDEYVTILPTNGSINDMIEDNDNENQHSMKRHATSLYDDHPKRIETSKNNLVSSIELNNPITYEQAINGKDRLKWSAAIKDELNNLYNNKIMTLVKKVPKNKSIISTKWVFTKKKDGNNNVSKYKARLVARGFSQKYGTDFDLTYSPTLNSDSLKLIIAFASSLKWNLYQLDIKSAYLNAKLDKTIYTNIPQGDKNYGNGYWRLNKSLYGLRQSGRQWYKTLSNFFISNGFRQLKSELCIFYKKRDNKITCIVGIYVDDMLIAGLIQEIKNFINNISSEFKISNCEKAKYILGINIEYKNNCYLIHQRNFIDNLLSTYNIKNIRSTNTPCTGYNLISENTTPFDSTIYKSAIGSLIYLAKCTRPDISFAVHKAARKCEKPNVSDWKSILNILKYLNSTKDFKIIYNGNGYIHAYSDSDFAGDINDRKSTSGHIILMGNSPICWFSKKQSIVATSTAEAEYISISECAKKALWLRNILIELFNDYKPITIFTDNMAAKISIENNEINTKLKHISIKYYFNKDNIIHKRIKLEYKNTNEMLADILTKNVNGSKMKKFTDTIFFKNKIQLIN